MSDFLRLLFFFVRVNEYVGLHKNVLKFDTIVQNVDFSWYVKKWNFFDFPCTFPY